MNKRRIIAIVIAFVLTIAATAMWSAATIEREGDPDVNALEDSGSEAGATMETKKGGNRVVKVLAAPFKAFGRLFGHKDENKISRMTEKDSERFVSVGVSKVEDSRTADSRKVIEGSAKEHLEAGRSYLLEGRYSEAVTERSTAASMNPNLTEAHNLLGVAYDKKGFADHIFTWEISPCTRVRAIHGVVAHYDVMIFPNQKLVGLGWEIPRQVRHPKIVGHLLIEVA